MNKGTPTLILLEDNDEDYQMVQTACRKFGRPIHLQRYTTVEDLLNGLSGNRLGHVSLFLLDLRLPGGSGLDALDAVKNHPAYQETPAIVWTTTENPKEIKLSYRKRANAFHIKQIEFSKTLQLLHRILSYWLEDCVRGPECRGELHA